MQIPDTRIYHQQCAFACPGNSDLWNEEQELTNHPNKNL